VQWPWILDYVALVLLIVIIELIVYGVIAILGIPCEIAKSGNHPHGSVRICRNYLFCNTIKIKF
jgi:hypothetical protein